MSDQRHHGSTTEVSVHSLLAGASRSPLAHISSNREDAFQRAARAGNLLRLCVTRSWGAKVRRGASDMAMMNLYINTTRNMCRMGDEPRRRAEARRTVKLFLVPRDAGMPISNAMVPDHLVSEAMIDRFLEIEPPQVRGTTDFDAIIEEIERAYVLGAFFSALSVSVVTIERMLNTARIELHKLSSPKLPKLWNRQSTMYGSRTSTLWQVGIPK